MKRLLLSALLIVSALSLQAQSATILPYGSVWKYLDDGTNQGTAWQAGGFDDSTWISGPAQLGYGDSDEATATGYIDVDPADGIQKNATTYFRTSFVVADPSLFTSLSLTLLYDDAGAVFINGNEVARTPNLSANAAYDQYANASSSDNTTGNWVLPVSVLNSGTNTIAVEIHQRSNDSSDLSFDLELLGVSQSAVTRGPYLQLQNASGITIRWRTAGPTDSVVWTGTAPGALAVAATDGTSTTEHELRVNALQPDTTYYYAVGKTGTITAGNDALHFFKTAPLPGTDRPVRIWALGDCGTNNANQRAVRDAYYSSSEYAVNDLILLLGDNAYDTGTDAEYQAAIFDHYPSVLRQSPVWSCLGNHETAQATNGAYSGVPYLDIFSFPTAAECGGYPSNTERYFSWDFGNVHFISLDTQTTDSTLRANMLAWLENDLAANNRRWTIAIWHHPPYTKGSHNSDSESQLIWARQNLVPALEAAGVDLVLSGHSHAYERSRFIDGFHATPTLATSGAMIDQGDGRADGDGIYGKDYGANRGAVFAVAGSSGKVSNWNNGSSATVNPAPHPVMFTSLRTLGSMILDITDNRLDVRFLSGTGSIDDHFTIEKGPLVAVTTPVPDAAESGPVPGTFSLSRSGTTTAALEVTVSLSGNAPSNRYQPIAGPVTVSAGSAAQSIDIVPIPNNIAQGSQAVTLTILPNVAYRLGTPNTGTITISDVPAGAPPIADWLLAKFGVNANNSSISGDSRDPDGDGILNLLEYALDLEPLIPSTTGLPAVEIDGDYLTLTAQRNPAATDVSLSAEATGTLLNPASWNPNAADVLQDTSTLFQARDTIPVSGTTNRFIRLRVTR